MKGNYNIKITTAKADDLVPLHDFCLKTNSKEFCFIHSKGLNRLATKRRALLQPGFLALELYCDPGHIDSSLFLHLPPFAVLYYLLQLCLFSFS
ncbi:hypothetical protein AQUCO_00100701v1 [Aquilegia coerulea]|uniref:Uncharacterized protein n=1 Tax=Aquilegia coerulea TaxID=218851 RepID=A0A2G5FBW8_AQUCA|nr:hypothetical protein AQUCO_00100701v1 [Aquilegia coerulea]